MGGYMPPVPPWFLRLAYISLDLSACAWGLLDHVAVASGQLPNRMPVTVLLQVLLMSNNNVKDWGEFQKLAELPCLEVLLFVGRLKPG